MDEGAETIVHAIRAHALRRPDETALVFTRGEGADERLTYRALDRRAEAFAAGLRATLGPGALVLLPMRSDARSVVALCACLYAGLPCAPVPLPPRQGSLRRLQATAAASACAAVIVPDDAAHTASALPGVPVLSEDGACAVPHAPLARPHGPDLALVQYTSGSAAEPKGVLLTHANIAANLAMLRQAFRVEASDRYASWLPLFHDMGLAMLLMPLQFGVPGTLMPPLTFLRRPERWLQMVDRHGATITGAPNFAFEACARRVGEADLAALDLSRLRLAFCGAEPVRRATMRLFARRFRPAGFRPSALYPCYGMAEAVTFVSGGHLALDPDEPAGPEGRAPPVSCGAPAAGSEVAIVDPDTGEPLPDGTAGEIWVAGPHVGLGYLGAPEATRAGFGARLRPCTGRTYLRTGDLGVRDANGLTVTGRIKDIVIQRGANIHAVDIEAAVAACHPGFGAVGAAFAWEADGSEQVVLVHEAARGAEAPARAGMLRAALDAVAFHEGVRLHDLVLVRPGSLPKTSSGKVRRDACRDLYATNTLKPVFSLVDRA